MAALKSGFLIFFLLNLLNVSASDPDLRQAQKLSFKNDTSRAQFYYTEGFNSRTKDLQYSYECARLSENYALKSKSPYYVAQAYNLLGILYYRKHDLATALSYHKKALEIRNTIDDKKGIALSHVNLGNIYGEMRCYVLAENFYLKALSISNDLKNTQQTGNCLLNLGVIHSEQGNASVAKNYFYSALENAK
ncbi:MAG: tetratricopeptide repeat proteinhistidine kinase, partial [Bacteroidetes bacterium]|nr:tetratricopeptide repeat proteinhistidine kinase [Bacteroidota bacterium]